MAITLTLEVGARTKVWEPSPANAALITAALEARGAGEETVFDTFVRTLESYVRTLVVNHLTGTAVGEIGLHEDILA